MFNVEIPKQSLEYYYFSIMFSEKDNLFEYILHSFDAHWLWQDFVNVVVPGSLYELFLNMPGAGDYHGLWHLVLPIEGPDLLRHLESIHDGHAQVSKDQAVSV